MSTRRQFLKTIGAIAGGTWAGGTTKGWAGLNSQQAWLMPDENAAHLRTWMAFGASESIWGRRLLPLVQRNLASIALTIAKYEPVSMLVRPSDLALAKRLMGEKVKLIPCPLNDLWIRDTGPVFVTKEGAEKAAVDFNFNGWGEKQAHDDDAGVAAFVARVAGVRRIETNLVLEGGGLEVDGQGTAIITESCVLNENRNPGLSKSQCERELRRLLGIEKVIWLPGIQGEDITDGHTDFYARFARPGIVVAGDDPDPDSFDHEVMKEHLRLLKKATDARGHKLEIVVLQAPEKIRRGFNEEEFAAGYVNFYVCNGAVLLPEFGDATADEKAKRQLEELFPERDVIQLNIDGIAAGGGGIHCATLQEPKA